jgi:hypothetical protein
LILRFPEGEHIRKRPEGEHIRTCNSRNNSVRIGERVKFQTEEGLIISCIYSQSLQNKNEIIWFDCIFKDGIPAETSRKKPGYIPQGFEKGLLIVMNLRDEECVNAELMLSSRQFVMKNGGRTPTLAKVAKVMCHSKENLRTCARRVLSGG